MFEYDVIIDFFGNGDCRERDRSVACNEDVRQPARRPPGPAFVLLGLSSFSRGAREPLFVQFSAALVDVFGYSRHASLDFLGAALEVVWGSTAQGGQPAGQRDALGENASPLGLDAFLAPSLGSRQPSAGRLFQPTRIGRLFQVTIVYGQSRDLAVVSQHRPVPGENAAARARRTFNAFDGLRRFATIGLAVEGLERNDPGENNRGAGGDGRQHPAQPAACVGARLLFGAVGRQVGPIEVFARSHQLHRGLRTHSLTINSGKEIAAV